MSNKMQLYTVYFFCKPLYIFRVFSPHIIRSTNNCICSIWYWSTVVATGRYLGGVETPDDGWRNHPKQVKQFTDKINGV